MTLICVTLSDGDDWNDHMALLDYGFSTYDMMTAVPAGQALASTLVENGTVPLITLGPDRDLACPVAEGERLTVTVSAPGSVSAPVVPGQAVGTASLWLEDACVATVDLVALEPSAEYTPPEEKGFFARLFGG